MLRLVRARYPSTGRTEIASPRVFSQRELGASPLASRLATSHRPNRVSYRTDWPFTSCCSPPRVTTTQLQAVTSYVDLERTFTPPTRCALRRTAGGRWPLSVQSGSAYRRGRARLRASKEGPEKRRKRHKDRRSATGEPNWALAKGRNRQPDSFPAAFSAASMVTSGSTRLRGPATGGTTP